MLYMFLCQSIIEMLRYAQDLQQPFPACDKIYHYNHKRGNFTQGHGEPYSFDAQGAGEEHEAWEHEDYSAQEGEDYCGLGAFDALEIAHSNKVHYKEEEACRKIGEAAYGYLRSILGCGDEEADQQPREHRECDYRKQ